MVMKTDNWHEHRLIGLLSGQVADPGTACTQHNEQQRANTARRSKHRTQHTTGCRNVSLSILTLGNVLQTGIDSN